MDQDQISRNQSWLDGTNYRKIPKLSIYGNEEKAKRLGSWNISINGSTTLEGSCIRWSELISDIKGIGRSIRDARIGPCQR